MAEIEEGGQTVSGLPVPSPDEARIRAQNARRLARRRQAAALSLEIGRTSGEDLDRFGDQRTVGGTFESLQAIPERQATPFNTLDLSDIGTFLQGLSFAPGSQRLDSTSFFSSFAPFLLGLNATGADSDSP